MPTLRKNVRNFGTSLNFSGSANYVQITHSSSLNLGGTTSSYSVSTWFKSPRKTSVCSMVQKWASVSGAYPFALRFLATGITRFTIYDGTANPAVDSTKSLDDGNWHHIVGVRDVAADKLYIYIDGVLDNSATDTTTATCANTQNMLIGARNTVGELYTGLLDEVYIWNVALTAAQISSFYLQNTIPAAGNIVGSWLFDEGSGTNATDSSGNRNTGTITGATFSTDVATISRTTVSNRLVLRNFTYAPHFIAASSQRVTNTTSITDYDTASSISFWLNADDVTSVRGVAQLGTGSSSRVGISVSAGLLRAGFFNGASYTAKSGPIVPNRWYHVVFTWDGTTASLYINGVAQTGTQQPASAVITGVAVGYSSSYLNGYMSEVKVWTRVLSASEVLDLYYRNTYSTTNLWLSWDLNEGSGATAIDSSGNGKTGSISGSATYSSSVVPMISRSIANNRISGKYIDITSDVIVGNIYGIVSELTNGTLLSAIDRNIKKSTDGGLTWSTVYTFGGAADSTRLKYIASNGYIYFGAANNSVNTATMIRSTDNGSTFSVVATSESSAWWRMAEDSSHNLYASEYSLGNQDASELYAYNIWKSTDNGANWTKFHSEPAQSTPGAKDGIRHVHGVYCDSSDRLYCSFGDQPLGFGGNAGKTFNLNTDGSLGNQIATVEGNGFVTFLEIDTNHNIFTGDTSPYRVYNYYPGTNNYFNAIDFKSYFGNGYDMAAFDVIKGKDGVIYILLRGVVGSQPPCLVSSTNNGQSWRLLKFTTATNINCDYMTLNRNKAGSRIYISVAGSGVNGYISIPDYTKAQIDAMVGTNI